MYLKALANVITFGIIGNVKIYILLKKNIIGDDVIFTNELHCVLPDWLIQHFGRNILLLLSGFGDISLLSCLQL